MGADAVNFKRDVSGSVEQNIQKVTEALKGAGFGVLTRIDFHSKIKEKLNQEIPPTVILGACNPKLALEAFQRDPNVTSLLPCNVVVRETERGTTSVEIVRPTAIMKALDDRELVDMARSADDLLQQVLENL